MHDCRISEGARVERSIVDKEVVVGAHTAVGLGDPNTVNVTHPEHLYSGLTVIGKRTIIPGGITIGTNCVIDPMLGPGTFPREVGSGMTIAGA
jgi:glucose-1-phosphate adenylyltransferase